MNKYLKQLGVCMSISFILLACSSNEEKKGEVIRPVKYQKAGLGGGIKRRTFSGTAISGTETRMSFKVPGNIQSLQVKDGDEVKKNQLLVTLDATDYRLQYEQADAALKNAEAMLTQAKSNYERIRSLYENGSTSLSEFENAKANYESAKANENSAKQAKKLARSQLDYCRLYAPIQGTISSLTVEINENVRAGQAIMVLSSEGDLEVNLGIPESFITNVNVQDQVEISFSALTGEVFKGIVSEVSYSINNQTSTYPVVVKLVGDTKSIRPGMAASVTFSINTSKPGEPDVLRVPVAAVGEDETGNFVFVLEPSDEHYIVKRRPVTVGELTTFGFEILDGLEEGELIATAGLQILLEDMEVRLYDN
ncbi:MAG TPA: efflux RND transporter periplasmic adaptor subunit [Cyclobacteriaceae bacterium]